MNRFAVAICFLFAGAAASGGCAQKSPTAPTGAASLTSGGSPARAAVGSYSLSFYALRAGALEPVNTLPVLSEPLILGAAVTDASGIPAPDGTVVFEYCSYKGLPSNDISRPDEAPMEACEEGSATWARLTAVPVDAGSCPGLGIGTACMSFGRVQIPRTVGFRFQFLGQGSGIANYKNTARNFSWTAQ